VNAVCSLVQCDKENKIPKLEYKGLKIQMYNTSENDEYLSGLKYM
jgi:hypothetical protein